MADEEQENDQTSPRAVIGNGLKVALVAGSILGTGFLLWRWREGAREENELRELEARVAEPVAAAAAPATLIAAPSCSCGGGDSNAKLEELRREVLRRLSA